MTDCQEVDRQQSQIEPMQTVNRAKLWTQNIKEQNRIQNRTEKKLDTD